MDGAPDSDLAFMNGGGEMGALMRAHDWSTSSVGPPRSWPQPLRTTVRLMLNTGHPIFIIWGSEGACFYNDAFRPSIGDERHPGALGRPAKEVWEEIWPDISPQIEQVMAGRGATWHENQLLPITRNGVLETVYWTYSYGPIDNPAAPTGVGGVLVICTETTQTVLAEQRRAEEAARQRRLFEQAPGFIIIMSGPDHVVEFVNDAHRRTFNSADWTGRTIRDAFPSIEGQGFFELLDDVYATGAAFDAQEAEVRYRRKPDAPEETRYLTFTYAPLMGEDGAPTGIFCLGFDVTIGHRAQLAEARQLRHQKLLVDELNHRVKNTLAIVQSLAQQSFRGESAAARQAFEGRLVALANAHNVLTDEGWESADLGDIVRGALQAHATAESRFHLEGPEVRLPPQSAVAVALVLHELTTNAMKYGALTQDQGRVEVSWDLRQGDEPCVDLCWRESGGPPVTAPGHNGFGSRMIERAMAGEGGKARLDFRPEGVVCELSMGLHADAA
jgi:two-component sensor histidine kinase